jgi:hypothetical protein
MDEAEKHVAEALELLDDAPARRPGPKPSVRAIRGYLSDADFSLKNGDSNRAVAALGLALEAIESSVPGLPAVCARAFRIHGALPTATLVGAAVAWTQ